MNADEYALRQQIADEIEAALLTGAEAVRQTVIEGPMLSRLKASHIATRIARGEAA